MVERIGVNSPADWDVDDVLTFLHVVIQPYNEDKIKTEIGYNDQGELMNTGRVGIMGGSRGGSPAYLAKLRDSLSGANEINRAIITFGSVTDWFSTDIESACLMYVYNDGYVPETTFHYYNEDYDFFKKILEPCLHGDLSVNDARLMMLRSSPKYFALDGSTYVLNHVQVNQGMLDNMVRPAQSSTMFGPMLGDLTSKVHYYQYSGHVPGINDPDDGSHNYGYDTNDWLEKIWNGQ